MVKYDYIIVGSGLFGAVFAYRAHECGKRVLVLEKRPHLGGNVYCEKVCGINVHKYGAHIFHTNNKQVWDFVNAIVPFNRYTNCPVANYKGKLYNLPFNMNTFYQMWGVTTPAQAQAKINEQRAEALAKLSAMKAETLSADKVDAMESVASDQGELQNSGTQNFEPSNLEEQALMLVGRDIYEKLIKDYTEKQWGRDCKDLPAFIIKRLPVRLVYDNNYFNDKYQGIPEGGYNKLIDGLLDGVECRVDTDFFASDCPETGRPYAQCWREVADRLVYTGPIDEYFGFRLGRLDWRTVSFKTRVEDCPNYQGNAVVNYTSHDEPYTRVIEHKHFEMFGQQVYDCPKTVVSEEYSTEYKPGMEPYYPVNNDRNNALADAYRQLAAQQQNVIFGGRLAEYRYYDMAPVIEQALTAASTII